MHEETALKILKELSEINQALKKVLCFQMLQAKRFQEKERERESADRNDALPAVGDAPELSRVEG